MSAHTPSRLHASATALTDILTDAPDLLRRDDASDAILGILAERRTMDLTDLAPRAQAELIAGRAARLLPGVDRLTELLAAARAENRALTVKFGIDPTAADVHLGHTVPMILAARFQRMGHRVVIIVGDITARIGDPSGRTGDRPPLTDEDVRRNLATYRAQVAPSFDFERAEFRFNSEWLAGFTLPRLLGVLEKLPASASLQREDFRARLTDGSGLTMAELVYSVVMALDSVEIDADVELGGIDQLLNMQMCRRVMENAGRSPELIAATGLIEGTDGTGAKMSKSKKNYVAVAGSPADVFGGLMSAADRLLPAYLRAHVRGRPAVAGVPAGPDRTARPGGRAAAGRADPPDGRQVAARRRRDGHDSRRAGRGRGTRRVPSPFLAAPLLGHGRRPDDQARPGRATSRPAMSRSETSRSARRS